MAKKLGFSGVGLLSGTGGLLEGVELTSVKGLEKHRGKLVVVKADTPETSRNAAEYKGVDIVLGDMDAVAVRRAKRHKVAIGFDFSRLLHSSGRKRGDILASYLSLAKRVRKVRARFVLTSGARSPWDMRSPSDLVSFGNVLGLERPKEGLDDWILKKKKKQTRELLPGVREL